MVSSIAKFPLCIIKDRYVSQWGLFRVELFQEIRNFERLPVPKYCQSNLARPHGVQRQKVDKIKPEEKRFSGAKVTMGPEECSFFGSVFCWFWTKKDAHLPDIIKILFANEFVCN